MQLRLCRHRRPGLSEVSSLHLQGGGALRFLQVQDLTIRLPHLAPRAGERRAGATAGGVRRRDCVAALPRADMPRGRGRRCYDEQVFTPQTQARHMRGVN